MNVSIGNLTGPGGQEIHANNVQIRYKNSTIRPWTGWTNFNTYTGPNNWTVFIFGNVSTYHYHFADGAKNMTMADWRVSIPVAQAEGQYTSQIWYRIYANPV